MKKRSMVLVLASVFAMVSGLAVGAFAQDVRLMSPEDLNGILGSPDLVIVDVRSGGDWLMSDSKIQDAVREDPGKVSEWIDKYPKDKKLVFYCA